MIAFSFDMRTDDAQRLGCGEEETHSDSI